MRALQPADLEAVASAAVDYEAARSKKIADLAGAMATNFDVSPASFSVVNTRANSGARTFYTVMYSELLGLRLGSWNQIMDGDPKKFIVEVDGEEYDTRKGMTEAVHRAFIKDAKGDRMYPNRPLADSYDLRGMEQGVEHPGTWLTGEWYSESTALWAQAYGRGPDGFLSFGIDDRKSDVERLGKDYGGTNQRFRPAVTIEE